MPDPQALNASIMTFAIGSIHIITSMYTEQIISFIIGSAFILLSYKLFTYGDIGWSKDALVSKGVEESPEVV